MNFNMIKKLLAILSVVLFANQASASIDQVYRSLS